MKGIAQFLHLGTTIVLSMGFFTFLGYSIDRWLGCSPLGILVGILLGTFLSFVYLYRMAVNSDARRS